MTLEKKTVDGEKQKKANVSMGSFNEKYEKSDRFLSIIEEPLIFGKSLQMK